MKENKTGTPLQFILWSGAAEIASIFLTTMPIAAGGPARFFSLSLSLSSRLPYSLCSFRNRGDDANNYNNDQPLLRPTTKQLQCISRSHQLTCFTVLEMKWRKDMHTLVKVRLLAACLRCIDWKPERPRPLEHIYEFPVVEYRPSYIEWDDARPLAVPGAVVGQFQNFAEDKFEHGANALAADDLAGSIPREVVGGPVGSDEALQPRGDRGPVQAGGGWSHRSGSREHPIAGAIVRARRIAIRKQRRRQFVAGDACERGDESGNEVAHDELI